jgi:2-amino-4-hydroxy-6-hydroxymethyldihydropteridine diphosphokinase
MTRVVLSIGSNLGNRQARLQSGVDGLGESVVAVSPVYETAPWGGVDQGQFLNAVVIADDPALDCRDWLERGQQLEQAAERVRGERWGPRTLDVDLISCSSNGTEYVLRDPDLTLPHPMAHLRAFVLVPWLAVEPTGALTVGGVRQPLIRLLDDIDPLDRAGVVATDLTLRWGV